MKHKKGTLEIQFNWIFVLIIGAVILLLFSGIILRQKDISETSKNALILNNLDAILSGSEVSAGTVNVFDIPKTNIEFSCNRYSVGGLSKQLDVMNVFVPSSIEGNKLISMVLDFSIPYRATNLIYLTSPKYRYVFVGNNGLTTKLKDMMPDEVFSEIYSDLSGISYNDEEKTRFIFVDTPISLPSDFNSVLDDKVTALEVISSSKDIEFFKKQGTSFVSSGTSFYLKNDDLLGAIISDTQEIYECVMANVFEKINIITQIYLSKVQKLPIEYQTNGNSRCASLQSTAYSTSNLLLIKNSKDFLKSNSINILNAAKDLETQNKEVQLQSCATIY